MLSVGKERRAAFTEIESPHVELHQQRDEASGRYCTQVLHLSEHAAYNRIETALAAVRFPVIHELVESAAVTVTTVRLLAPHLTEANHRDVLERARHKSKRDVELLVATLHPRPDGPVNRAEVAGAANDHDDGRGFASECHD